MYFVYIVECQNGHLYTGYTNDIDERIRRHNAGQGARYTKANRPVTLVYSEALETKSLAMKREVAIKKMKREEKLALIQTPPFG